MILPVARPVSVGASVAETAKTLPPVSCRSRWLDLQGERAANRLRRRAPEQLMLVGFVVDAVEVRTMNDGAGVEERNALLFGDLFEPLAEQARLLGSALEHLRIGGELGERRRRDQQDLRSAAVWAFAIGADQEDEARRALGDVKGGEGEPLLQIVAAEREND